MDAELDRLMEQNNIEPSMFSHWATPIVPVLKSDKSSSRICSDFKVTVNKVSQLDRYPIPRTEELFAQLAGGKVFSKIESEAYQQLLLDEESKKYVVINTHRGLFRYNRLPFGDSSVLEFSKRTMENLQSRCLHG